MSLENTNNDLSLSGVDTPTISRERYSMSKYGHRIGNWHEAIVNKIGGEKRADAFLNGELVITVPSPTRRLKLRTTIDCPKIERFVAKDNFSRGTVNGVRFCDFGNSFKRLFLPKSDIDVAEAILSFYELLSNSKDLRIIHEIEEGKEVTSLAHLHYLLTLQGEGQDGVLLTNGYANIFYIVGTDGNLWAVYAYWGDDGWCLYANSFENEDGWIAGSRVFSR